MSISLTTEKACKVKDACATLLNNPSPTIREESQVLGLLTPGMPRVMYGPLNYRSLDMSRTVALQDLEVTMINLCFYPVVQNVT